MNPVTRTRPGDTKGRSVLTRPGHAQNELGDLGNIELGGSTLISMFPNTDLMVTLGSSVKRYLDAYFAGDIYKRVGSSTGAGRVGTVVVSSTTAVGNVGVGEDDLISIQLAANSLATDGSTTDILAFGSFAATVNNKRVRLYIGTSVLVDTGAAAFNNATSGWVVQATIVRTGAATQDCIARVHAIAGATVADVTTYAATTRTLSLPNTIKCTGEATANNDVVQEYMRMMVYPAP